MKIFEKVSAERIQTELVKMLVSPHPDRILEAWELGITGVMLPEFDACMACMQNNPHHMDTVGEHIANALQYVEPDKVLRLSMLLHDIGKPQTKTTDANGSIILWACSGWRRADSKDSAPPEV